MGFSEESLLRKRLLLLLGWCEELLLLLRLLRRERLLGLLLLELLLLGEELVELLLGQLRWLLKVLASRARGHGGRLPELGRGLLGQELLGAGHRGCRGRGGSWDGEVG